MPERLRQEKQTPKWLHDAIRNNIPGFQISPGRFESVPYNYRIYDCKVLSITEKDPGEMLDEGVYVVTTIPGNLLKTEMQPIMQEILKPLNDIVVDAAKANANLGISADQKIRDLGYRHIALKVDLNVMDGFVFLQVFDSGNELTGFNPQTGFENLKEEIVSHYFTDMTLIDRVKLLAGTEMPDALKREILKHELSNINLALDTAIAENLVTKDGLREISFDELHQSMYEHLVHKMEMAETKAEKDKLAAQLTLMSPRVLGGFYEFYKKYMKEKFGTV